ncbi:MAG: hypothetical protein ABSH20_19570 [Tepidisphaeraceae bacterium]|jgi:hypothetical protein
MVLAIAGVPAAVALADAAIAAEAPKPLIPQDLEATIDHGLFYLQKLQKSDGSFETAAPPAASAALVVLAMLASGHTPDLGKYGQTLRSAVEYLLGQGGDKGYFGAEGSKMYGHAIATLVLAQVHGTELDENLRRRVRQSLDKALKIITTSQDAKKERDIYAGGWRYEPTSTDADLSVTGWCVAAMRGCLSVGLPVPRERFERAAAFALRCYRADRKAFAYQPQQDPSSAMTAAGMLCLAAVESAVRGEMSSAAQFLIDNPVKESTPYMYYSVYCTTHAASGIGEKGWTAVWKQNLALLQPLQRKEDGAWPARGSSEPAGDNRPGRLYPTTMACLALSVPLRLAPMFRR